MPSTRSTDRFISRTIVPTILSSVAGLRELSPGCHSSPLLIEPADESALVRHALNGSSHSRRPLELTASSQLLSLVPRQAQQVVVPLAIRVCTQVRLSDIRPDDADGAGAI